MSFIVSWELKLRKLVHIREVILGKIFQFLKTRTEENFRKGEIFGGCMGHGFCSLCEIKVN